MPFTPYHFGPSGLIGLIFRRWLDLPVFVLANVLMDFEPGTVMFFNLDYPMHGFVHTLLISSAVGLLWGFIAFKLRAVLKAAMKFLRLPYAPVLRTMLLSGLLGVWFHRLLDSLVWRDIRPLWPLDINPLRGLVGLYTLETICMICLYTAFGMYILILMINHFCRRKTED